MSVYTTIEQSELEALLARYNVGELVGYEGISEGIENTNYFVDTRLGRFVLTIFEQHSFEEMQYFLNLMHHLADNGVPSANPVADESGAYLGRCQGKPMALVERLEGRSITSTTVAHCEQIGNALGRLHTAGGSFGEHRANPRGARWRAETAREVSTKVAVKDQMTLAAEAAFELEYQDIDIPRGVVHADLFRDNALWDGDRLSGIIDLYYACDDALLFDLAVTANDWCRNEDNSLDRERTVALLTSYHRERPFTADEQELWPVMLRAGALRFWLSRLYDKHFPRDGEIVTRHDPEEFRAIVYDRIIKHDDYLEYWVAR